MSKSRRVGLIAAGGLVGALALPAAIEAHGHTKAVLIARLDGAQEIPGPGDPDGRGVAVIKVDTEDGTICYLLAARRIDPAAMAHIHLGDRGEAGPVVQGLTPPTDGLSAACVTNDALADQLAADPGAYYVNVHNAPYPGGAVRGQLR